MSAGWDEEVLKLSEGRKDLFYIDLLNPAT